MPFIKRGDIRIQPGDFDQPVDFYSIDPTLDPSGGVVNPATQAQGTPTLVYSMFANISPFNSQELPDAERLVGDTWSVISIPYYATALPKQGMRCKIKMTGDEYEVRGVDHLSFSRQKVELTCKLVV